MQEEEDTVSGVLSLDNLCPQIELSDIIFNVRRFRVKSVIVQPYLYIYIPPGLTLLNPYRDAKLTTFYIPNFLNCICI